MSLYRPDAKRDAAEPEIIAALQGVGAQVWQLSDPGIPDLLVEFREDCFLLEVKTGNKSLTDKQEKFHQTYNAHNLFIVRSADEALRAVGAIS